MRTFVFGPVPSRRLGFSLGVDVIPAKACTYDCIYCQIGRTTKESIRREAFFDREEVLESVLGRVKSAPRVDYITFSGSGEPTLNSDLGWMIHRLKETVNTPVAVITNGSLLFVEDVRRDLLEADIVLPSLDAASEDMFRYINRPHAELELERIVEGLVRFREQYGGTIWLEIMLIRGANDEKDELEKLRAITERVRADKIQLNTVVRPPIEETAADFSEEELESTREFFGPTCEVIGSFCPEIRTGAVVENWVEIVLSVIDRRSLSLDDIIQITGVPYDEAKKGLRSLEREGRIKSYNFGNAKFFVKVS